MTIDTVKLDSSILHHPSKIVLVKLAMKLFMNSIKIVKEKLQGRHISTQRRRVDRLVAAQSRR